MPPTTQKTSPQASFISFSYTLKLSRVNRQVSWLTHLTLFFVFPLGDIRKEKVVFTVAGAALDSHQTSLLSSLP